MRLVLSVVAALTISKPQNMLQVVAETDEPFVPVPDDLIVNLRESREAVEALLDNLASSFATATSVSPATAAANAATPTSYDACSSAA